MEVFVKRENWDGGIWMKPPASEEQAEQVLEELAGYHPSRMIPFIGDVESAGGWSGTSVNWRICISGFKPGAVKLPCRKAWFLVGTGAGCLRDCAAGMKSRIPLLRIVEAMEHLDQYECHPEIKSLEQYGHYLFEWEGRTRRWN